MSNEPTIQEDNVLSYIDLLVDNELDSAERQKLFEFCNSNEQYWKSCAIAFIDNQMLQSSVMSEWIAAPAGSEQTIATHSNLPPKKASLDGNQKGQAIQVRSNGRGSKLASLGFLAAGILFFLFGGILFAQGLVPKTENNGFASGKQGKQSEVESVNITDETPPVLSNAVYRIDDIKNVVQSVKTAYQAKRNFDSLPKFIEVKNNEKEAVYYVDQCSAEFMIESMILAGHGVTVETEFIQVDLPGGNFESMPLIAIRIEKFKRLGAY